MEIEEAIKQINDIGSLGIEVFTDKELMSLDMAIQALKKQIEIEPVETWDDGFVCQICNGFVTCQKYENGKPCLVELKYCPHCGQKLDWSVE